MRPNTAFNHTPTTTSVVHAAKALGVSAWALRQSIHDGDCPVPYLRVGRALRFPLRPIAELLGEDPDKIAHRLGLVDGEER